MKYHTTSNTIIISLIVLLVFISVAVFTVVFLSMTSPTLILTERILDELEAADSGVSVSFEGIDRNFRDGISIHGLKIGIDGQEAAEFSSVRVHMSLFSLIRYLAFADGSLAVEASDGMISIPGLPAGSGSAGGDGHESPLDVLSRYSLSVHLHRIDISLPHGITLGDAALSLYMDRGIEGLSGSLSAGEVSAAGDYGSASSEGVLLEFGYGGGGIDAALFASGISLDIRGTRAEAGDLTARGRIAGDIMQSEIRASLSRLSFSSGGITAATGSSSVSYSPAGINLVMLNGSVSYGDASASFSRLDGLTRGFEQAEVSVHGLNGAYGGFGFSSGGISAHLDAAGRSASVTSGLASITFDNDGVDRIDLGGLSATLAMDGDGYRASFSSSATAGGSDGIFSGSEGSIGVEAGFQDGSISYIQAGLSSVTLPFIDDEIALSFAMQDDTYAFILSCGDQVRAEGSYGSSAFLDISISDFRLSQLRPFAERYLPALTRYIGESTALTGSVMVDVASYGSGLIGPMSLGLAVSDIAFGPYSFSIGAFLSSEFEGDTLSVADASLTTDWGRLSWTGYVDLGRMLPDGRFTISSTETGEELFIASLDLAEDNEYTFSARIPRFRNSWFQGRVDFTDADVVSSSASLRTGNTIYPFTVTVDTAERIISLGNEALAIEAEYGDGIRGSAVFSGLALPVPSADIAPTVLTGRIDAGFDLATQALSISVPSFQVVNMRHLPTAPDLSFSAHGGNDGIVFSDIVLAGIETEPLRGMMDLSFSSREYALYLSSSSEELMASAVLSDGVLSGILRLNRFDMKRLGLPGYAGDVNLAGHGGTFSDMSFSGTVALRSEDMINDSRNINAMMYIDSDELRLENLTFLRDALSIYSEEVSYSSADGRFGADFSIAYSSGGDEPEASASFTIEAGLPRGSTIAEAVSSAVSEGLSVSGSIILGGIDADGRLHVGERESSFSYADGRIELEGTLASGYVDTGAKTFDISFDLAPIAAAGIRGDYGAMSFAADIPLLEVSVANMLFRSPTMVFHDPAALEGRIWLDRKGPSWDLSGYLSGENVSFEVFWLPDELVILHNPTFTIWNNRLQSNLDDCTVMRLDTYERTPGRASFSAVLDSTLSFGSYSFDVFIEEGDEIRVRVPLSASNIDIWGDVSGHFAFSSDLVTTEITGELETEDLRMSIGMEPLPDWWEEEAQRVRINTDLDLLLKENVSFVFPLRANPILTANLDEDQRLRLRADANGFDLSGNLEIRSGEFYYFQKNFYITEGSIGFRESEDGGFDPIINLRAKLRDFDANGRSVDIYLVLRNSTLDNISPTFESSPAKDINEIMTILGGAILPSAAYGNISFASVASLVSASVDMLSTFGVIDGQDIGLEQTVRTALDLDTFSLHSNIVQNIFLDTVSLASSSLDSNLSPMARYLNGTSIYMGKYLMPQLYLEAMIHLEANSDLKESRNTFIADDLDLDIEISLEWETPMCTFRFFTQPSNFTFYDLIDSVGFGFTRRIVW